MKLNLLQVFHHDKEDDPDCYGDHHGVTLWMGDTLIARYGDEYHDKGQVKMMGFVDAIRSLGYEVKVTFESRADSDCGDLDLDANGWVAPTPLYEIT